MNIWQIIEELLDCVTDMTRIDPVMVPSQCNFVDDIAMNYYNKNTNTFDAQGYVRERQRIARLAWIRERIS